MRSCIPTNSRYRYTDRALSVLSLFLLQMMAKELSRSYLLNGYLKRTYSLIKFMHFGVGEIVMNIALQSLIVTSFAAVSAVTRGAGALVLVDFVFTCSPI